MLQSKKGYVYILINEFYQEDLLKIGMTTRSPEIRSYELYDKHSGVPGKFKVIYKKRVEDCEFAEALIHKNLGEYRVNDYREFF